MPTHDYAEIAAACDRLLRAPDSSLARVAIPFLHVIDPHPGHLSQYGPLRSSAAVSSPVPAIGRARFVARTARDVVRSMRPAQSRLGVNSRAPPVDVMIFSRAARAPSPDPADDFYFGPMLRLLTERGVRGALVNIDRIPFSPRVELDISRQCRQARRELVRFSDFCVDTLDAAVARLASRHALAGMTAANLRIHAAVCRLCAQFNPRIVITTYEGPASERMIWSAARTGGRSPLCVGYQHTRLLPHAHAVRRSLGMPQVNGDPDIVMTMGEVTHSTLAASSDLRGIRLITYGSHRRTSVSRPPAVGPERTRCLVLPDSNPGECATLFEFALECARRAPAIAFILRPHPAVDLVAMRGRAPSLRDLPSNVQFSSLAALDADCAHSACCLYRASSAAVHAVLAGVKPLYLARKGEMLLDPLLELTDWRESVSSPEDFIAAWERERKSTDAEPALRAWKYCDRYVSRIRPEALDELLSFHSDRPSRLSSSAMSSAK
jgi:hypothetical protein